MPCWISDSEDVFAACQFCGRFIAEEYAQSLPFFMTGFTGKDNTVKVIAVAGAVWCGLCRPQPEPIEMPELW
ncbi:MAG: hypothetical protein ACLFTK_15125 [Anaerolineales bacterium]